MARRILSYLLLMLVVAWLVLSYLPATIFSPPRFSSEGNPDLYRLMALLVLVSMVAIQGGLLGATGRIVRNYRMRNQRSDLVPTNIFPLRVSAELFWTCVPLLMICAIGLLSFSIWGAAWL